MARTESSTKRSRLLLFRVLVPLLSLALLFAVFEIGLRIAGFDPLGRVLDGRAYFLRASSRPGLDYDLAPGVHGRNWGADIEINSHGFRDREYPLDKLAGTTRVVVIGDSIAFGNNMAIADTFPKQLESLYAKAGRPVEVLNLAVAGYDTLEEVTFLEQTGVPLSPDVVVVGFCINDLGTHSVNLALVRVLDRYGFLTRHSRVFQWLTKRADTAQTLLDREFQVGEPEDVFAKDNQGRIAVVRDDPEVQRLAGRLMGLWRQDQGTITYPFLPWYLSEARLGKLRYSFERLAELSRTHGFRVVVLLIPFLDDQGRPETYRAAYDLVRHEADRLGFRTTDPTELFRQRGFEALMQREGDKTDVVHPNVEGHAILARQLYTALDEALPKDASGR